MQQILKIIFLCLVISLSTFALKAGNELTKVTLQLKWKHQFQFAGYYAAIEKGYYRDLGLDVTLIEPGEEETPAHALIEGVADFAISASDVVLMRSEGKPVVVLATIFQHSAQILLATSKSGIKNVHNLPNKRLMIEPHSADLIAYMNDEGINLKHVESIPHTFGVEMLVDGKVDAMTAYRSDEPFILKSLDIEYSIISPISGGIDFYGDVLITTEQKVKINPALVIRFREATLNGWKYAMNNPDEMVDIIYSKYSQRHSKEHLLFEASQMINLIQPDIIEIGYSNMGRWKRIIDIYKQVDMLAANSTVEGLMYTDYLKKEINIPWKLIGTFLFVLLFIGALAIFFYRLTIKLRSEIIYRKQVQLKLVENEQKLIYSNEKLKMLSQFKEDMTNMIIHDLNSSLSIVISVKQLNDEEGLNIVQQAGYKMLNLVQNILGVYKYENTKIKVSLSENYLLSVIESALKEVQVLAKQKEISIEYKNNSGYQVNADKDLLIRVFVNLLSNAIKFSKFGGKVGITSEINEQNIVSITVSNEGPTIPKDKQLQIFERFGQSEKKNSGPIRSTGLGLAFCKMAIEAHGGQIGVKSEPNSEVNFWFNLPNGNYENIKNIDMVGKGKYDIELSKAELEYLKPFVKQLINKKIFEASTINKTLKEINSTSTNIKNWVKLIEELIYEGDNENYQKLLTMENFS